MSSVAQMRIILMDVSFYVPFHLLWKRKKGVKEKCICFIYIFTIGQRQSTRVCFQLLFCIHFGGTFLGKPSTFYVKSIVLTDCLFCFSARRCLYGSNEGFGHIQGHWREC